MLVPSSLGLKIRIEIRAILGAKGRVWWRRQNIGRQAMGLRVVRSEERGLIGYPRAETGSSLSGK